MGRMMPAWRFRQEPHAGMVLTGSSIIPRKVWGRPKSDLCHRKVAGAAVRRVSERGYTECFLFASPDPLATFPHPAPRRSRLTFMDCHNRLLCTHFQAGSAHRKQEQEMGGWEGREVRVPVPQSLPMMDSDGQWLSGQAPAWQTFLPASALSLAIYKNSSL